MQILLSKLHMRFKNALEYIQENSIPLFFSLITIVGCIYYYARSSSGVAPETIAVSRGLISQYVRITGAVQPSNDASLAFQAPGAVEFIGVKIGDVVTQGKVLATLSGADAQATLLQAEANLQNTQATLGSLLQGARPEELAVKQQSVDNAAGALDQVYLTIPDVIRNVDVTTGDIVKNKLASLFTYAGGRYILSFTSCDQSLQSRVETLRSEIENTLSDFQKQSSTISTISSRDALSKSFDKAYQATLATNDLINNASALLFAPCSTTNASLDTYRATLSTARTTMTVLFSEISTKRTTLSTAINSYNQVKRDLDLTKAGADPYRIKGQDALVKQAEAQVASAKAGLEKTKIVAPFSGTISDVSIVRGETVTVGKTVISILTTNAYEVEAKIPEIDVTKIRVGSKVAITLDAYGTGVVFPATVTRINPTASTEGNVPVYKTLVTFNGADERIKSGMTANVKIETENKEEALTLPARFVKVIDETKGTVVVRVGKVDTVKDVTLGIRGENGLIEITSGLQVGDVVVAPTTEDRSAQKQTS